MGSIVLREFARVGIGELRQISLDQALIPESAFAWLCAESARLSTAGASLVQIEGHRWLRLDNYVGVLETPCGLQIEILPKHLESDTEALGGRRLLQRMLTAIWRLPRRESDVAGLHAFNRPLTEWVMREFLTALEQLVRRGLRFDYHPVQERQAFLKGRLLVSEQMRQPPGRDHRFCIEHSVFDADRPENRLLRSTLDKVCRTTQEPSNWRLSHELATYLAPVPSSRDITTDFKRWRDDRLMTYYRPLRPWCELILSGRNPLAVAGQWRGVSVLFPMEKLFERYVEVLLRRQLPLQHTLRPTPKTEHLCMHRFQGWFNLQPDFLVQAQHRSWILDTKWKRIDESKSDTADKYELKQSDFYQLFAYGHKYLGAQGDMALIYPRTRSFTQPLPVFTLGSDLRLWVLPFDLESGTVMGLEHTGITHTAGTGIAAA